MAALSTRSAPLAAGISRACSSPAALPAHCPATTPSYRSRKHNLAPTAALMNKSHSMRMSDSHISLHLTPTTKMQIASSSSRIGRKSGAVTVRAGWGAPVTFSPAKVVMNKRLCDGLHSLVLDIGEQAAGAYTKPGQFIQVKVGADSKPGFFAIASPPDPNNRGAVELLIKRQPGATADLLCGTSEGDSVEVSPVMGKGFPVDRIPADSHSTVHIFATGSGISPIKALIESGALDVGKRGAVNLWYGTKSADKTAYQHLIPAWEAAGVKVKQVFSADNKGYIQDVFASEGALNDPNSTGAVLCGHKGMCEAVTATLTKAGVAADKILLNF